MRLNEIPFEKGPLPTMIERLCKTMNAMDREWSQKVEPASQSQIQSLAEILKPYGTSIPLAYLLFLQAMGMNDNGLLEQEWDGTTEVNLDIALSECSEDYNDFFPNGLLPFSFHWTEATLSIKLSEGDDPPVFLYQDSLFSRSFENSLFQMAFRQAGYTQFLYEIEYAASKVVFRDILSKKPEQTMSPMEFIESILKPYQLQKTWFSDDVRFRAISSEYMIIADLSWALNIMIYSDNYTVLQNMKNSLSYPFSGLGWRRIRKINRE